MPITPFHVGPGVLCKSVGGRHVSLTVFAMTQVTMDVEVLGRVVAGSRHLHGFTNTLLGATVVLLVTVPLARPPCGFLLRWWNRNLSPGQARWLRVCPELSWSSAWIGGGLGVYSHFVLDAMMHWDARPWAPFSEANPFVGLLTIEQLHLACLLGLVLGVAWVVVRRFLFTDRPGALPCRPSSGSGVDET